MQKAITDKRGKLAPLGFASGSPEAILLLYDAYEFGEADDAQEALLNTEGYEWFHSAFWVVSSAEISDPPSAQGTARKGAFLYSKDAIWWMPTTSRGNV